MQDLIKTINTQIRALEAQLSKLRKAKALLEPADSKTKKPVRMRRRRAGSKSYREYIIPILEEEQASGLIHPRGLTTYEIVRELGKLGIKPKSENPDAVISACLRTMAKAGLIERGNSERGILNSIPPSSSKPANPKADTPEATRPDGASVEESGV